MMATQSVTPSVPLPSLSDEWNASFISYTTWSWLDPLLTLGRKRPLELADLGGLAECDQSSVLANDLMKLFSLKPAGRTANLHLWLCLATLQIRNVTFGSLAKEIGDLCALVGPISLQGIVNFVALRSSGKTDVYLGGMEMGYW